jgi:hypothetical protein
MEHNGRSMINSGKASIISVDPVDYYRQYTENTANDDVNNFENLIVAECYLSFT